MFCRLYLVKCDVAESNIADRVEGTSISITQQKHLKTLFTIKMNWLFDKINLAFNSKPYMC